MKTIQKTWNEFWGEFLLVTFHKDNPDKWRPVEEKASWVWNNTNLSSGSKVLDLCCGSGMLDIQLAKLGAQVTGIDRIKPVLDIARAEAGNLPVEFIHGDVKNVNYPANTFESVLFLETAGLMDKENDKMIIEKSFNMLKPGGIFLIDSPDPQHAGKNFWEKETSEGLLSFETEYDSTSSMQTITPLLKTKDGSLIELYDPYNPDNENHKGVRRYLYDKEELRGIIESAGFTAIEVPHYWGGQYYAFTAVKN